MGFHYPRSNLELHIFWMFHGTYLLYGVAISKSYRVSISHKRHDVSVQSTMSQTTDTSFLRRSCTQHPKPNDKPVTAHCYYCYKKGAGLAVTCLLGLVLHETPLRDEKEDPNAQEEEVVRYSQSQILTQLVN